VPESNSDTIEAKNQNGFEEAKICTKIVEFKKNVWIKNQAQMAKRSIGKKNGLSVLFI
jgi:hypothetical protein